jgi:hypothetical protein
MRLDKTHDLARERAARLLDQATHDLVRVAADLQAKDVDTSPLTQPFLTIGQDIKLLRGDEPPDALSAFNTDQPLKEGSLTPDQTSGL